MFTCVCGGLGVIRNADVVCGTCGLVLMTMKTSVSTSGIPYPDAGELWLKIRSRIQDEPANDAKFLKNLGIKPLDE